MPVRPQQSDSSDSVNDLRREIEGKLHWYLGIIILVLLAVFGGLWHEISVMNDKISGLNDRVLHLEDAIKQHWKN